MGKSGHFQPEIWEAAITENIGVFSRPPVAQTDGPLQPNGDQRASPTATTLTAGGNQMPLRFYRRLCAAKREAEEDWGR